MFRPLRSIHAALVQYYTISNLLLTELMGNIFDDILPAARRLINKVSTLELLMEFSILATGHSQSITITSQPQPQTDCYGNHVEFSVSITGSIGTVLYQWQQKPPGGSFSGITGANNALLNIDNIGVNKQNVNGTEYRVLITDTDGTITSDPALLSINSITDLTPAIVNSTICYGSSITYKVFTEGNVIDNGYQWAWNNGSGWTFLSDGEAYSGTTTSQLTISGATTAQNGSYRVSVRFHTLNQPGGDTTCIETSSTRVRNLIVRAPLSPPVISASQQICYGNIPSGLTATKASGGSGPDYSYKWQSSYDGLDFNDVPDADKLSYSPAAMTSTMYYRILATDTGSPNCGIVYSIPVMISVSLLPNTSSIYHR
jgi:hypothetical protein